MKSVMIPRKRSTASVLATAFAIYTIASILLFYRYGLINGTHYLGNGTDPFLYIWIFRFLPWAIEHLHNPFIIPLAWAPYGLNITQATTTPGLALLFWPITALVGPVVSFNIVSLLSPSLGATAAFLFAYEVTERRLASLIGGWIFGFSSYEFGALLGHLQTDFVVFVPLSFLVITIYSKGKISKAKLISLLTIINACQFLTSLETFVTSGIFLSIFVISIDVQKSNFADYFRRVSADSLIILLIISYAITAVIISPFLYYFFYDYSHIPHILQNGGYFAIDLLNFIVPTIITYFGGDLFSSITTHFQGNWSEELGYIGLPLAIFSVIAVRKSWPIGSAKPVIVTLIIALVFVLGPSLHIDGTEIFLLPWAALEKLPLLGNALPDRMMVFVVLCIGVICAIWLSQLKHSYYVACGVVAASAMLTLPNSFSIKKTPWYTHLPSATLFRDGTYKRYITKNEVVLFVPLSPSAGNALIWQVLTNGYFRTINGYGNFIPQSINAWPAVQMLTGGQVGLDFPQQFNLFVKHNDVRKVIVPEAYWATWGVALARAGWHSHVVGRLAVYHTTDEVWTKIPRNTVSRAQLEFDEAHMMALRKAAACLLGKRAVRLDPAVAVDDGCMSQTIHAASGNQRTNWDNLGGWLGFFGEGIGVGVTTSGPVAKRIVANAGAGIQKIYFPYPKTYQAKKKYGNKQGELLLVYDRSGFDHLE
ncbi:hypothetical protein [Acidiphilium acidophilum]|uniref:hypothetical protein n=1 Tax=Acidiphilium acidophilum TaxID=76588 RepID=UPI002E8E6ED6|nr:hypothetical protein [Acidiphilium acidophilum]